MNRVTTWQQNLGVWNHSWHTRIAVKDCSMLRYNIAVHVTWWEGVCFCLEQTGVKTTRTAATTIQRMKSIDQHELQGTACLQTLNLSACYELPASTSTTQTMQTTIISSLSAYVGHCYHGSLNSVLCYGSCCKLHRESKKVRHWVCHNFIKYWPILPLSRSLNIPPHLKRVAILPCEILTLEN